MSTQFSIDAPATVGDVVSWSVTENATQASPVEPVRGTPAFGAVVKRTDKTKFAAHQGASIVDERLGATSGYVRSIGPGATSAALDCQTVLNQLNVDAEFSETFFPEGLLSDYVKQLVGTAGVTVAAGTVPPPEPDAGTLWTAGSAPSESWNSIAYGNGLFVAGQDSSSSHIMTSSDGLAWTVLAEDVPLTTIASIAYGNGLFVAVGAGATPVMTSPDGVTWTPQAGPSAVWRSITYGNGLFVAVVTNGSRVMTSPDGVTWTPYVIPTQSWSSVTFGGGLFVAVASSGTTVMTSPDGVTWTPQTEPGGLWGSVTYGDGLFVALAFSGTKRAMTSPDGSTWTATTTPTASWAAVDYGNGLFVAVASGGQIMTSPDGVTWTLATQPDAKGRVSLAYANGLFVAVGNNSVATSGIFSPPSEWGSRTDPVVTYIPWRGNIWQMLNSLLMLNDVELVYSGGQMVVRDIGSVVMELDDTTVITRTITAVDARQSVDVGYREAFIQSGTIYDAYEDGNKVYSVETNEYRVDEVVYEVPLTRYNLETNKMEQYGVTTNVPTALDQPLEAPYETDRPAAGYYVLSDRDNYPLFPGQFEDYGGKIEVALNPDNPFSFLLRWNGPKTEIPGAPGPYSLAADGQGAFSVTGTATYATDKKVNVRTGADPAIVTDATPLALDLPFVNSKLQAFDVGAKAGADLCATVEEVTFSVATEKLEGFGLTPGSIFRWDNAYWRVVSATIGRAATAITARAHTTFGQVDSELADLTYGEFDTMWAAHGYKDFKIEPLRTA